MEEYNTINLGKSLYGAIGKKLQVKVKTKRLQISFESVLIGVNVGKHLLMKMNHIDDTTRELFKDNDIIVTYMQTGAFLGFHTKLISIISDPENIVFLKYPDLIENFDRRSQQRINCFLLARFSINSYLFDGPIIDINTKGCCLKVNEKKITNIVKLNKTTIFLQSDPSKDIHSILGKVVCIRSIRNATLIGVTFNKMNRKTQRVIQNIIPNLAFKH